MKKIISLLILAASTVYFSYANSFHDAKTLATFYADTDNDGYGDAANSIIAAGPPPPGYVYNWWDCNDNDSLIHPYAAEPCNGIDDDCDGLIDDNSGEYCNGIDDDCDGLIDDNDPNLFATSWYADADGDGYRDPAIVVIACSAPQGFVHPDSPIDCDDTETAIHPGGQEICNGIDDNCDGLIDPEVCNGLDDDCDGLIDDNDPGVMLSTFLRRL